MSLKSKFEMKKEYLHLKVSGDFSIDEACSLFVKGFETIASHKSSKILADLINVNGRPSVTDYYIYGSSIANELIKFWNKKGGGALQLAHVAAEPLFDSDRFADLVAANRGANMKSFNNIDDALEWLGVDQRRES